MPGHRHISFQKFLQSTLRAYSKLEVLYAIDSGLAGTGSLNDNFFFGRSTDLSKGMNLFYDSDQTALIDR